MLIRYQAKLVTNLHMRNIGLSLQNCDMNVSNCSNLNIIASYLRRGGFCQQKTRDKCTLYTHNDGLWRPKFRSSLNFTSGLYYYPAESVSLTECLRIPFD